MNRTVSAFCFKQDTMYSKETGNIEIVEGGVYYVSHINVVHDGSYYRILVVLCLPMLRLKVPMFGRVHLVIHSTFHNMVEHTVLHLFMLRARERLIWGVFISKLSLWIKICSEGIEKINVQYKANQFLR